MAVSPAKGPAVDCAENIALLHALHSIPVPPSRNARDPLGCNTGYTLSFDQERNLTGALSFLSSLSDNPNHVAAVCLEEDHEAVKLRLLVAVNKGEPNDSVSVLHELKGGYERVLGPLGRITTEDVKDEVFSAIVSMCRERILCRMRLVPNTRNLAKKPFQDVLQQAVTALRKHPNDRVIHLVQAAKAVIQSVNEWAQHQVSARLEALVRSVSRLHTTAGFLDAVNALPNTEMGPTSRQNLLNITAKVAQYRTIAQFLCGTAQTASILQRVSIVLVGLPAAAFTRTRPGADYRPDMASKLQQVCGLRTRPQSRLDQIYGLLQTDRVQAGRRFELQVRKTMGEGKIHAEVQLLIFCAPRTGLLRPRVIRSSKDACFLCNAFLAMEHTVHTSRCHGKLYPGWRLPHTTDEATQTRFNEVLAQTIRDSVKTIQARRKKTEYPGPNESTLTSLPSWTASSSMEQVLHDPRAQSDDTKHLVASEAGPSAWQSEADSPDSSGASEAGPSAWRIEANSPESSDIPPIPSPVDDGDENTVPGASTPPGADTVLGVSVPSRDSTPPEINTLPEVRTPSAAIQSSVLSGCIQDGTASLLYGIPPFEILIEYAPGRRPESGPDVGPTHFNFHIERIVAEDARRLWEGQVSITDVECLPAGDERAQTLDDRGCLYIAARNAVLKIRFCFQNKAPESRP